MKTKKKFKFSEWLDKPWTNRTYIRYCAICSAVGAVAGAIWTAWLNREEIHDWAEDNITAAKEKIG